MSANGTIKDDDINLASFSQHVLNECLYTVIHDLVLQTHQKEKQLLQTLDPKTQIPVCQNCSLPRLLDPPLSISRPDKSTQYCSAVPWSRRPGHDIYGNPFPVAGSDKPPTKKEREARAKAEREERKNSNNKKDTPNADPSSPKDEGPNIAGGPVDKKAAKVDQRLKDGTYIPWHTCPNCKRSLLITRFAQHLASCLGIGGRARAAARASTAAGSVGSGTPGGSRAATPLPGSGARGRDGADDDSDSDDVKKGGNVRKKLLKKGLKNSASLGNVGGGGKPEFVKPSKLAVSNKDAKMGKIPRSGGDLLGASGEKRERDVDDDDSNTGTPVRKKVKVQRQMSMASVGDMSVDGEESVDGSFVNHDEEEESEG